MSWSVVAEVIGIVGQPTIVRLMPGLRPSRTGVLAFLFLVGGRRLRRSPRRFVRSLKLDHQLNQLVLAQALQISAIHAHMDSEIGLPGKGARKSGASSRSARRKWRWVITIGITHEGCDGSSAFVFDLMKPERPVVDRKVLEFVKGHVFDPAD